MRGCGQLRNVHSQVVTDSPSDTVSLNKPDSAQPRGSGALARKSGTSGAARTVAPPSTINAATTAMLVMVVGNLLFALLLLGNTAMLQRYVLHANATASSPQDPFDAVHAVYALRQGAFLTAALYGVLLLVLAFGLRRQRGASACRWVVLIILVYTQMPVWVLPVPGLPVPAQAVRVIAGLLSIAVVLLIFVPPQSRDYFRRCRAANLPEGAQPRPGFGSLFAPRPPRGAAAGGRGPAGRTDQLPATRGASAAGAAAGSAARPAAKARAKVRADSDAVAKGAELARSRAKASKSRRTVD